MLKRLGPTQQSLEVLGGERLPTGDPLYAVVCQKNGERAFVLTAGNKQGGAGTTVQR